MGNTQPSRAFALGAATVLVAPSESAVGFTLTGDALGVGQRDYRVFNNFVDPTANDNTGTKIMFPGATMAEMAIWKGNAEWGSTLHGTGQGDPSQSVGDGLANFDTLWAGNASVSLDLSHPEGRQLAHEIAGRCGVALENFGPGVADSVRAG